MEGVYYCIGKRLGYVTHMLQVLHTENFYY